MALRSRPEPAAPAGPDCRTPALRRRPGPPGVNRRGAQVEPAAAADASSGAAAGEVSQLEPVGVGQDLQHLQASATPGGDPSAAAAAAPLDTSRPALRLSIVDARRLCTWCERPLPPNARADAVTCSKRCRQSKAAFRVAPAGSAAPRPLRFGYADPPYPGLARRCYGDQPLHQEVNHEVLIGTLMRDFPDGWALSTSERALPMVLKLCPDEVRTRAWFKGPRSGAASGPRSAWEPVIMYRGRPHELAVGEELSDALLYGGRHRSLPKALIGMKPAAFCEWLFRCLGARAGDQLVDIFPGSGAVARAWALYARLGPDDVCYPEACTDGWTTAGTFANLATLDEGGGVVSAGAASSTFAGAERRLAELEAGGNPNDRT